MASSLNYPKNESSKLKELDKLLKQWRNKVAKSKVLLREDNIKYPGNKRFSPDGFFPYYFKQKYRVLFVAREDRHKWNTVKKWTDIFQEADIYIQHFFVPLLEILYGIENNFSTSYKDNPDRNEIAETIGKRNGLSFAILELSKYGNVNSDSGHYDKDLMKSFFEHSDLGNTHFFEKELSILDPHIIITSNIWNTTGIKKYIENYVFPDYKKIYGNKYCCLGKVTINNKSVPLLDTYHFSAQGKNHQDTQVEKWFYKPVMKMINSKKFEKAFPDFKK
jgi:hypothetical protein